MGGILSGPKPQVQDTSAIDAARKKAEDRAKSAEDKNTAMIKNRRSKSKGRAMFAFQGITEKPGLSDTLG